MQQRTHKTRVFSTLRSTQTLSTDANTNSTSGLILFPTLANQGEGLLVGNYTFLLYESFQKVA